MLLSLWRRCLSEFLAMAVIIFIGKSAIANEILPTTKGHKMGWGFVSFATGLAFFVGIQMFGQISAIVNPAYCVSLWLVGDLDGLDVLALGISEILGAFVGATLVWILYLPHFPPHTKTSSPQKLELVDETAPLLTHLVEEGTSIIGDTQDPPPSSEQYNTTSNLSATTADQEAKLAIFATRPAVPNILLNWVAEFIGTAVLLTGVMMFNKRLSYAGDDAVVAMAVDTLSAFLCGMLIFVVVLALGGPTGLAANPALDLGPRLAHLLLPIHGKGPSEFGYAWIPFTAPYAAGAFVGGFYLWLSAVFFG